MRLMIIWSVVFTVALQCWIAGAQSNYAERGVDIEYQGNGIPLEATLDGIVTKLDDLTHVIRTNRSVVVINQLKSKKIRNPFNAEFFFPFTLTYRSAASLSCASRAMEVDLEFSEPFYGIVYSNFDRRSACSFVGKGGTKYHYEFPLSGCGTIQVYISTCHISLFVFILTFFLDSSTGRNYGEKKNQRKIIIIKMAFVARRDICCRL